MDSKPATSLFEDEPSTASTAGSLDILREEVAACTRCAELVGHRTQTVFGVGNPDARLCFFGEAPGADEDRVGEPFVGRAGQMLTRIVAELTVAPCGTLTAVNRQPPDRIPPAELPAKMFAPPYHALASV